MATASHRSPATWIKCSVRDRVGSARCRVGGRGSSAPGHLLGRSAWPDYGATSVARDPSRPVRRDRAIPLGRAPHPRTLPVARRTRPPTTHVASPLRPQPTAAQQRMPPTDPRRTDRTPELARDSPRLATRRVRLVAHLVGAREGAALDSFFYGRRCQDTFRPATRPDGSGIGRPSSVSAQGYRSYLPG